MSQNGSLASFFRLAHFNQRNGFRDFKANDISQGHIPKKDLVLLLSP
jgi:hypothetical protein